MEEEAEAAGVVEVKKRKCCQDEGPATLREASGPPSKMRSGRDCLAWKEGVVSLTRAAFLEKRGWSPLVGSRR